MINNSELPLSSLTNAQQSLMISDNVLQLDASSNHVQNTQSPDTTPSNSTSLTLFSMPIAVDNDDNPMQKSLSLKVESQRKRKFQANESSYKTRELPKRTRRR